MIFWRCFMDKVFAIYSRKSKFTGKGESVENQIEMCRDYLKMHFGEEEAEKAVVFEDEGFSGKNLDRPQFKEMMKAVKDKKICAVVCYRLDRISRNIGDFATLITELNAIEVGFISIREQFDTNSPMGRAMMYIASVFSQLERETIAERIRDNLHELAKTGRWLGGITPTGYISQGEETVNIDGKKKKAFRLAEKEDEKELVKLIFSKFKETDSLTATEAYLLEHHFKTKNGKDFTRFSVKSILVNPVYMIADTDAYKYLNECGVELYSDESEFDGVHGIMAYNRTHQEQGKATKIKPMEEWIVSVGKHPGFISGADFVAVQNMLHRNQSKAYRKERSHTALLSGLLKCGKCGEFMRPHMTKRINKDNELTYYYSCNLKLRSKKSRCDGKNAGGNEIDKKVIEAIKALDLDGEDYFASLKKTLSQNGIEKNDSESEAVKLQEEIEQAEKDIQKLVDSLTDSGGAEKYILQRIDELGRKVSNDKARLATIQSDNRELFDRINAVDLMKDLIKHFANNVDKLSIEQKRLAVRAFVKEVIWDGEYAHIVFFGGEYDDSVSNTVKTTESPDENGIFYPSGTHRKRDTYALPYD